MQTAEDSRRIVDIGANPDKVKVMGNLKFDISGVLSQTEIDDLKNSLEVSSNRLIIAGSTHNGEDEIILKAFKKLKEDFSELKLMIVPRHPERYKKVLELLSNSGFEYGQRSKNDTFKEKDIIMLDTMGELGKMYAASYLAFVGGSFSNTGGHNPLEPAIYGVPVISGPTVFNFKDIYKFMTEYNAAIVVDSEEEFLQKAKNLLSDDDMYNKMSQNCRKIFTENKGALENALSIINNFI
jgi:3-deoxy-D-manno-octulosonic-acid transferase